MRNHELGAINSQERNKGVDEKLTRTLENGGCGNGRNKYRRYDRNRYIRYDRNGRSGNGRNRCYGCGRSSG